MIRHMLQIFALTQYYIYIADAMQEKLFGERLASTHTVKKICIVFS
jgi:hypothetical protein